MPQDFLSNLIRYIVAEVQDANGIVFRTRLVKLLYLCDIEYYRSTRERLTDLEWKRYKFGPYAFELPEKTRRIGLDLGEEEVDFATGRGVKYEVYNVPDPDKWLTFSQKQIVDRVIKQWGNEDLNALLDYVYCDTEPMLGAQYRETLDFRKITRGMRRAVSDTLDLSASDKEAVRQLIDKHGIISRKPTIIKRAATQQSPDTVIETPILKGKVQSKDNTISLVEGRE